MINEEKGVVLGRRYPDFIPAGGVLANADPDVAVHGEEFDGLDLLR